MRAIMSVSDKTGVTDFAKGLSRLGFEVFSTGGTKKALAEAKVPVKSISQITRFPEILNGRVKTLHPAVHTDILARRDLPAHMQEQAKKFNYRKVSMVIEQVQLARLNAITKFDELVDWMEAWSIQTVYQLYTAGMSFLDLYERLRESRYKKKTEVEFVS